MGETLLVPAGTETINNLKYHSYGKATLLRGRMRWSDIMRSGSEGQNNEGLRAQSIGIACDSNQT